MILIRSEVEKMNRQKAEELASRYLTANIGEKVGPGLAYFDAEANEWIVPILYQPHFTQPPQRVGELYVDAATQIIRSPSLAELTAAVEQPRTGGLTIVLRFDHFDEAALETLAQLGQTRSAAAR